jgi:RNA polymerase sigma-70 factor (ECF subfamily)
MTPKAATHREGAADLSRVSDAELLRRCRDRDEAAIRLVTSRFNQRLYRMARGILRDDAEAEDAVQDAYIKAFTGPSPFRGESGAGTWLTRIVINEALGRVRRRRPMVEWRPETEAQFRARILPFPQPAQGGDPERQMAQRELRDVLERAIDELPVAFRTVFIARLVEGLSIEETAGLLALRPETVKTRLNRARGRLRVLLERELGPAYATAFAFDGARCERLTSAVLQRLGRSA